MTNHETLLGALVRFTLERKLVVVIGVGLMLLASAIQAPVGRAAELIPALTHAARFDTKLLAERGLDAREIEVAVLGNDPIEASVPGEIRTGRDFYDYEAKYHDDDTQLLIPAELPEATDQRIRQLAVEAFRVLKCWGMARVDFFVERDSGVVYVNELNTLPGFTEGSMYPRLWEASGISLPHLVDR